VTLEIEELELEKLKLEEMELEELKMEALNLEGRLWKWIGAPTASGAPPAGAPGLGPVEESASGGARGGGNAAKVGQWKWVVEEPAIGGLRIG